MTTSGWDAAAGSAAFAGEAAPPPVESVLDAAGADLVDRPETPFVALHAALAVAASGDLAQARHAARPLRGLRRADRAHHRGHRLRRPARRRASRTGVRRARLLTDVLPGLPRVGGSAAQREIVEETLLFCLVSDGQAERALTLLDGRLDRRTSPLDRRRRDSLTTADTALRV